jgi:hypothetical protein
MSNHGALTPIYYGKFPLPPVTAAATRFFHSEGGIPETAKNRIRNKNYYGAEVWACGFLDFIGSPARRSLACVPVPSLIQGDKTVTSVEVALFSPRHYA